MSHAYALYGSAQESPESDSERQSWRVVSGLLGGVSRWGLEAPLQTAELQWVSTQVRLNDMLAMVVLQQFVACIVRQRHLHK